MKAVELWKRISSLYRDRWYKVKRWTSNGDSKQAFNPRPSSATNIEFDQRREKTLVCNWSKKRSGGVQCTRLYAISIANHAACCPIRRRDVFVFTMLYHSPLLQSVSIWYVPIPVSVEKPLRRKDRLRESATKSYSAAATQSEAGIVNGLAVDGDSALSYNVNARTDYHNVNHRDGIAINQRLGGYIRTLISHI